MREQAAVVSCDFLVEWLIREDIEKAGCSAGAKLLQFFETPKSFERFLIYGLITNTIFKQYALSHNLFPDRSVALADDVDTLLGSRQLAAVKSISV